MPKITPFLWFDTQAEEAANFYVSVFPNSKIVGTMRSNDAIPGPANGVLTVEFELDGQTFTAMNGGPGHPPTDAVSFVIPCEDQAEVDRYWEALTANGGKEIQCGWLADRFGVSWQVTPTVLLKLMSDPDRAKAARVAQAMMRMVKIDIAGIEAAAEG